MAKKTTRSSKKTKLPGFEESVERLEAIIEAVESGRVPLEEGIEQYARGMELVKHCRAIPDEAEKKIENLSVDGKGKPSAGGGDA